MRAHRDYADLFVKDRPTQRGLEAGKSLEGVEKFAASGAD